MAANAQSQGAAAAAQPHPGTPEAVPRAAGAPASPTPPVNAASSTNAPVAEPVDNTLAWTLAFAPLLLVMVDGLLLAAGADESFIALSILVAVAFNSALSWADARRVRRAGYDVSVALAVFLVPLYLFKRAGQLRQKLAIPVVWCLCFVASFAGAGIVGNTVGVALDVPAVEATIKTGIQEQAGIAGVAVECPSAVSPKPGSSFKCIAESQGEQVFVEVTVQNTAGDIIWEVQ